ncbi:MAG: hypothetical protein A2X86_04080 [Bdellovibrionales bacterium GWA2_49_15]|nr:MAG: hypothetical protein A2X86_04080 [Bdellovibrionales bacterium GWA2_49_15]HAZ12815.1 hypothetical protein [Bdellovibrionales bacterium]
MEWNEFVINFDQMSAETLSLAQNLQSANIQSPLEEFKALPLEAECHVGEQVEGSGLLYHIDFQGQTFSIRGIAVHDLKVSYAQALQGSQEILAPLRMQQDFQSVEIKTFRTPTHATAEILADQLFNRRFPLHEDSYFNVSDPGPGLWLVDRGLPEFCLHFKRVFHQDLATHSLGPIIDPQVAARRFLELPETLAIWPKELVLKIDEKALILQSACGDSCIQSILEKLREIFCHARMTWKRSDFKNTAAGQTSYFFFLEMAFTRGLWMDIEEELNHLATAKR